MFQGTLISESLRPGTTLADVRLVVQRLARYAPLGVPDAQLDWPV